MEVGQRLSGFPENKFYRMQFQHFLFFFLRQKTFKHSVLFFLFIAYILAFYVVAFFGKNIYKNASATNRG